LIGFGFAFIPPYSVWQQWNYYFIINYGIIIMATVAAVLSLRIWKLTSSRIRYGGLTNLIVVVVAAIIGTLDTISWVLFSQSIIPGTATPILSLAAVVILFSLYSLWIIQRSFQQNK
jgi:membrane-associated HD superfamily phosphohydrolase